jgi:hypothetical protein
MTATELLTDFRARGLRLWGAGGGLHVAPRACLLDADRAALTAHKPALLALLADLDELERDGTAARLRAIATGLTPDEHQRLAAEAAEGDRLAALMVAVLATPTSSGSNALIERVEVLRCRCGGIAWNPDPSGVRERCTACGAWSPCSIGIEDTREETDRPPAGATEEDGR